MERTRRVASDASGLRRLAAAVDDALIDQTAVEMVAAMSAGVAEADDDADVHADALCASRESFRAFLGGIDADPWRVDGVPEGLADLARTLARRGLDVTVLMKLVRLGQGVFWPAIMETAEHAVENPSVRMRVLATAFDRFGTYVETTLDEAVKIFQHERDLRMRDAHARRQELIAALINDESLSADGASRALGYELRRSHTALVLWNADESPGVLDRLEAVARAIGAAVGPHRMLSAPSSSRRLWAWIATDGTLTETQRSSIEAVFVPQGLHAAIGQTGHGLTGFRRSHEEALAAQRIALINHDKTPITWYFDVEIVSLLSRDENGMRALVARELEGLTGADALSDKLRRTSLAYLRHGCSPTAAARELAVHTNTVRNRIEQAEEALGRPLAGQQLRLQLALLLVEAVGVSLLPDSAD